MFVKFCLICFCLVNESFALRNFNSKIDNLIQKNLSAIDVFIKLLPDGQVQKFIKNSDICAKEITFNWGEANVSLREVYLEKHEIKLEFVLKENKLIDCIKKNWTSGDVCMKDDNTWKRRKKLNNSNIDKVKEQFLWFDSGQNLEDRCNEIKYQINNEIWKEYLYQKRDRSDETIRSLNGKRRRRNIKRSGENMFIVPGTQWCGRGNRATKYTNLGGFGKADACCRKHDTACPFYIPSFGTRYGFFNWGLSTLMHCSCDERFRTCLKMAKTSSANFIGRIFFNIIQTKCFVLKPQKICIKSSWWGNCEKYEFRKQAFLRDNISY